VHAGISEDNQGLIDKTVALVHNQGQWKSQRFEARQLLDRTCSPESTLNQLESVYKQILK
ncbi:MAG: hypothetical protein ACKPES_15225, partial [Dolichospermum sp.]